MLLFRGPHWDRGLSQQELQAAMDKVMTWFEGLNVRGKVKAGDQITAKVYDGDFKTLHDVQVVPPKSSTPTPKK